MIRTKVFTKVIDSEVSPYIEQKDVILCRSGIQYYSYNEVVQALGEPPIKKEWYREYRPASVVVKAQNKCRSLPVVKEHPDVWVTPDNWGKLCGGVLDNEVTVTALDGESEGEIGLKSNVTFFTRELYEYYQSNKEVSLGYTCTKHFVDNPDEVGYDIILDEINEVNHLAITRAGRGGSSVAVIDSIIGGIKPMRTGIFAYLAGLMQKDSKSFSFGNTVLEAVKNSKGTTENELAGEMKSVLDSMSVLKDGETKKTLVDVVKDCFDNKDKVTAHADELKKTLDSMWEKAHKESVASFDSDDEKKEEKTEDSDEKKEEKTEDSDEKKEEKTEDSDEKKEEKTEDSDEKKGTDGCNKDSATAVITKDDVITAIKDALPEMVQQAVKDVLGIKDSGSKVDGGVVDSITDKYEGVSTRDYTSFLE